MSSGNPTTSTSKGDVEIMKPTNDRCKYRRFVLSNQMECLLIFDPAAEKSAVSVNVHAGYFCEEKGREGIAQLLQNYIFFGSNFFDGFYSLLVQNNGSFQISTLPERSTYTYDVGNSTLLDSLARFPKFFIDPTFNYETVQGLANGNLRVINLGDNQVNISAIDQAQRNLTVDDHPYHQYRFDNWRLVIDKIEKQSLSITNELEIFYKSYYSSRRMRLVIYGRESLDRLQGAVQKEFSVISERESRPLKFPSDPCENCAQVFVEAGSVDGARSLRLQWVLRRSINSQAVDACSYLGYVFRLESKGSLSDKLKTLGWSSRYEVYESDCCSNFSFFTVHIYLTENGEGHVKEICGLVFNYIKMLKKEKAKRYIYNQLEENAKAYFNNGMVSTAMSHVDNISSNLLIHSPERCLIGSVVPSNYSVKAIELIMSELSPDRVRIFWVSSTFKREGVSSEAHVIPYSLKKITVLTIKDWMKLVDKEVLCLPEDPKPHTTKTVRKKATSKTVRKEASASLECVPSREKESDSPTIKEAHQTEEKVKSPVIKEVEHSAEKNIDSPAIEEAQEIVGKVESPKTKETERSEGKLILPYSVCIIYDERMMTHKSSSPHVENPQRIRAIRDTLKDDGVLQRCSVYKSERAKLTYVTDVHEDDYVIRIIKGKIKKHKSNKEMYFGEESESAIFFAAGGAIKVSHMVVTGKHDHGFAIIRPPGHHATAGVDSGFCYFNNVAVAAKILKREHNMKRILILDWDVHFGDGTSEIFYQDKNVLFISMHRFPNFFPHTKDALSERIGTGEGTGYNCNICWGEPMITDDDLFAVIGYVVMPLAEHFKPEIILVSAGFDAAKDDKLGDCAVSKFGYATVLHKLLELNTNIVLVLEGGYNLSVIGECSSSCVKVLLGEKSEVKDTAEYYPLGSTWNEVLKVRNLLKPHWPGAFATDIPEEVLARKRKSVVPLPGPKPPKA